MNEFYVIIKNKKNMKNRIIFELNIFEIILLSVFLIVSGFIFAFQILGELQDGFFYSGGIVLAMWTLIIRKRKSSKLKS